MIGLGWRGRKDRRREGQLLGVGKLWEVAPSGPSSARRRCPVPRKPGVRGCPSSSCAARGQPEREARRGTPGAWIPRQSQARWDPWKRVAYVMDGAGWPSSFPLVTAGAEKGKGKKQKKKKKKRFPGRPALWKDFPNALIQNPTLALGIRDTSSPSIPLTGEA